MPARESPASSDSKAYLAQLAILTATYAAFAYVGLNWATVAGAGSPVWPASGIGLAALLLGGIRLWPAIVIGRVIAALLSGSAQPLWADVMIGFANVVGTVLPVLLIRRLGSFDPRLSTLTDVMRYLFGGALTGALLSGLIGTLILTVSSGLPFARAEAVFFNWVIGNFVGAVTLGPLVLSWSDRSWKKFPPKTWLHLGVVLAATLTLAWLAFTTPENEGLRTWHLLPALLWAALAFHVRGASLSLVAMATVAVWGTSEALGPFVQIASNAQGAVPLLQQFIAMSAISILLLASTADERRGKEAIARQAARASAAEERLQRAQEAGGIGSYEWALDSGEGSASANVARITGLPEERTVNLKDLLGVIHPDDREKVRATVHDIRHGAPEARTEYRIVRQSDGAVRWIYDVGMVSKQGYGPGLWAGTIQDVTERKIAELALAESETRLRSVVEQMPIGVSVATVPAGEFIVFNSAAERLLGHPMLPVGGVDDYASFGALHADGTAYAPDDYPLARTVRSGEAVEREEMIYRRGDGQLVQLEVSAAPIRDAAGQIVLAVAAFEDVTLRKAGEDALRASEDRVRRVLDQLFAFVGVMALDGTLLEVNRAPLEAAGLSADDVLGKRFWDAHWWSYSPAVQTRLKKAVGRAAIGETVRYEVPVQLAGDMPVMIDFQLAPLRGHDGRITHLIPSGVVIEDRVQAEAERRRLASILEATPDFVGTADAEGRALYLNPAGRRLAGLSPDEPLDELTISSFSPADVAERLAKEALPAAVANDVWKGESALLSPTGEPIPVSQVVIAHRDASGEVDFYSTIARDISERKQAEERERLLAREVDHRGKNLLAVVQSIVQLARADDVAELKAALTGRIQSLARTHSLLAASRWEGADLKRLVTEELAPHMKADGSRVRISGPSLRLKPAAAQALALVIHELSTNAAKYGSLGVEEGRLDITWALSVDVKGTGQVTLRWQERGGPHVSPPTQKGFGSMVTRTSIERQLKGRIDHDWLAGGLQCTLSLPASEVVGARPAPQPDDRPQHGGAVLPSPASLEGRRILVVEDEGLIAAQIEAALQEAGCMVVGPASTISEAVDLMHGRELDGALLDVNVAGDRSFAVADILTSRGVPVAFCTGYAGAAALPVRFRDFTIVAKPFTSADIVAAAQGITRAKPPILLATASVEDQQDQR